MTFGLAFGLTLATLTWVSGIMAGRGRDRLLGVFAAACVAEVTVITVQAWRGVPSHFNTGTSLDATLAYTAAAGGAVILATSIAGPAHRTAGPGAHRVAAPGRSRLALAVAAPVAHLIRPARPCFPSPGGRGARRGP